jgi:hypothetical protein
MVGLLLVKIRSSTYKHINSVLPSSSFFTYIACSYGFFLYIHCMFIWTFFKSIFLKILVNSGISSMHNLLQTIEGFLQLVYFAFIICFNISKWLFNIDLFF